MFFQPSWEVEEDVKEAQVHFTNNIEPTKIVSKKKKIITEDNIHQKCSVGSESIKRKKIKNKYKTLNEEQKKLKNNLNEFTKASSNKFHDKDKNNKSKNKSKKSLKEPVERNQSNNQFNISKKSKNRKITLSKRIPEPANDASIGKENLSKEFKKPRGVKRKLSETDKNDTSSKKKKIELEKLSKNSNQEDRTTENSKLKVQKIKDDNLSSKKKSNGKVDQVKSGNKDEFKVDKKVNPVLNNSDSSRPLQRARRRDLDKLKLQQVLRRAAAFDAHKQVPVGRKENKKVKNKKDSDDNGGGDDDKGSGGGDETMSSDDKGESLKKRMMAKLESARFRYLNQHLYTTSSQEAVHLFREDPDAFQAYHHGFTNQVQKWSVNPVDMMIDYINSRPPTLKVADFGCGDAKLAAGVKNKQVHSFDLVALNDRVTVADISDVPLASASMDIVVFCLSLMGTNLNQYLAEANRVLKMQGILLVAEVVSRFDKIGVFIKKLNKLGFYLLNKNDSNKMFVWFELRKLEPVGDKEQLVSIQLAPCIYKKR